MADDVQAQIKAARSHLQRLLTRVPDSINNGGYNASVNYKRQAAAAVKDLNKKSATLAALRSHIGLLEVYERS